MGAGYPAAASVRGGPGVGRRRSSHRYDLDAAFVAFAFALRDDTLELRERQVHDASIARIILIVCDDFSIGF
jgi:hypothetical protein